MPYVVTLVAYWLWTLINPGWTQRRLRLLMKDNEKQKKDAEAAELTKKRKQLQPNLDDLQGPPKAAAKGQQRKTV